MLIPSICIILLLGIYAAYEKSRDFQSQNTVLIEALSKHVVSQTNDAKSALASLSSSITRYDPFWFHWVLSNFLLAYPHYERLVYLSPNGKLLATSPQVDSLISMESFIDKVSDEPTLLSQPINSPLTHKVVVYIGMRMTNGNILIGELSIKSLNEHFTDMLPSGEGKLVLCDYYGNLISHPDYSKVVTQENIGHLSIIRDFREKGNHTALYESEGTYYYGTLASIQPNNWLLLRSQPVKDVFLPVLAPLFALLTIILSLFFIFAHLLQYKLRESIVKPLAAFTDSIELTAQGQYENVSSQLEQFKELSVIEDRFNDMLQRINAREQTNKESEERFRQLVENIHEVFWISDFDNEKIIYVSPSYEIIWGRTRESLYENADTFFMAIDAEDRFRVTDAFNALRTDGKIVDEKFKILLPTSNQRWVRAQAFPVYDDKGIRVRMVGIAEDITESRAIQTALVKAKQDAESANQAKTEFLTNMSHELRTPLNGILGMLQLTRDTKLTTEQFEYIDTAISSSKVLLNVINDILNIAQIEAGKLILHGQLFSLHEILETIYKFFKHSALSKNVDLTMEVEPGLPAHLIGDEVRIRQILFNLVGNSVKFTEDGSIHVHIQKLPIRPKDDFIVVLFTIADTGIGIPADKINYVFESFTQVDGTYTRRYQGTGLGLGIVKNLVTHMNGTITVDSDLGEGTTMFVTLQLKVPSKEQMAQLSVNKNINKDDHGRYTILIVEDDRVNQIAISRMLQKMGHSPTCVDNGKKALEALKKAEYDCVFMDIQMPIMDGIEATNIIRQSKDMAHLSVIPIVALTAHAMPGDRDKFLKMGMNDYISKPVTSDQLYAALEKLNLNEGQ
tara:strand:- start:24436 stop:26982 length:2547 start_codon:yes stop_codon:yes gene_type:complete